MRTYVASFVAVAVSAAHPGRRALVLLWSQSADSVAAPVPADSGAAPSRLPVRGLGAPTTSPTYEYTVLAGSPIYVYV